jgi:hypothetical protein
VGTVSITDNAVDSPQAVTLTGTGTAPIAALSPLSVSFTSQVVGSPSTPQSLKLSNTGSAALSVSGATLTGGASGDFALQNQCGGSLAPGANCNMSVTFTPTAAGTRVATLSIGTNASGDPQSVPITGVGVDFSLAASAGSATALTVAPGQQALYHVTVSPGGMQTSLTFSCTGAPAESTCQVSPAAVSLDGVTPVPVVVSVQTTASSRGGFRLPPLPFPWGDGNVSCAWVLLAFLALAGSMLALSKRRPAWSLAAVMLAATLLPGCGGGQMNVGSSVTQPGTPTGSYALAVTASSAGVTHTMNLTLTVQN